MRHGDNALAEDEYATGDEQRDITHKAAIVPPLEGPIRPVGGRDAIRQTPVVRLHYQDILCARLNDSTHVELKGSVAAFVFAQIFAIQPNAREVVDGLEAQPQMRRSNGLRHQKLPAIPAKAI